jgi:carboxyl-terminal processing protease
VPFRSLPALLAVLAALAVGLFLGGHPDRLPGSVRDVFVDDETATQSKAADVIKDNYASKVSRQRLENGSLRGMIDALDDRFSHYFTPKERAVFQESI